MTAITLRRYTNLAATIQILRSKSITLLNPSTWDDMSNGSELLTRIGVEELTTL